jgi:hypothetical protein
MWFVPLWVAPFASFHRSQFHPTGAVTDSNFTSDSTPPISAPVEQMRSVLQMTGRRTGSRNPVRVIVSVIPE